MSRVRRAFATCRWEKQAALITFMMAGFPSIEQTIDIMLGMEAGGADIIELGVPYADTTLDGPTIQLANVYALRNGVDIDACLGIVATAREKGLRAPVLLMGYLHPYQEYGEQRLITNCAINGLDGFIIADLLFEHSSKLCEGCAASDLSLIPLITPKTSKLYIRAICDAADSFVYVVSRNGKTGATGVSQTCPALRQLLKRVRKHSRQKPQAVGFGIKDRSDFEYIADLADGEVVGSQVITTIKKARTSGAPAAVKAYCKTLSGREGDVANVATVLQSSPAQLMIDRVSMVPRCMHIFSYPIQRLA